MYAFIWYVRVYIWFLVFKSKIISIRFVWHISQKNISSQHIGDLKKSGLAHFILSRFYTKFIDYLRIMIIWPCIMQSHVYWYNNKAIYTVALVKWLLIFISIADLIPNVCNKTVYCMHPVHINTVCVSVFFLLFLFACVCFNFVGLFVICSFWFVLYKIIGIYCDPLRLSTLTNEMWHRIVVYNRMIIKKQKCMCVSCCTLVTRYQMSRLLHLKYWNSVDSLDRTILNQNLIVSSIFP